MTEQSEALRLAHMLRTNEGRYQIRRDEAAAELYRLDAEVRTLRKCLFQTQEAAKALAAQVKYQKANPLGGQAKVFQAMADAIRAGDSYESVLLQFGYAEARQEVKL